MCLSYPTHFSSLEILCRNLFKIILSVSKECMLTILKRCDADPEVMSDYIIALLKHDAALSTQQWKEVRKLGWL